MKIRSKYSLYDIVKHFYFFIKKNFSSVDWYEIYNSKIHQKKNILKKKKIRLLVLKSKSEINRLNLSDYFKKNNLKLQRFGNKKKFLVLVNDKNILSSGWIYFGRRWTITEIQKKIKLKKTYLLFDFETPYEIRKKGYYTLLLRLIHNRYRKKRLAIYSVTSNYASNKAIIRSGFKFIERIYG